MFFQSLKEMFFDEQHRWPLWIPVGVGTGISLYFCLLFEPSLPQVAGGGVLTAIAFIGLRATHKENAFTQGLKWILVCLMAGFGLAKLETELINTPLLDAKQPNVLIQGTLVSIEHQPHQTRILIKLNRNTSGVKLDHVRVTVPKKLLNTLKGALPGHTLKGAVDLLPLTNSTWPGGYNFRRTSYFKGISAVGRLKKIYKISPPKTSTRFGSETIQRWRYMLTQILRERLAPPAGEIAAALVTGDRSGIPKAVRLSFANSGLAHLLAISGLHMVMIAGIVFFLIRRLFILILPLAERFDTRKIAAVFAILATAGYVLIAGGGKPAVRAFSMVLLSMIAILKDRTPLSMRLVSVVATVMLALQPSAILGPSFQMSFAAVIALIAVYENSYRWIQTTTTLWKKLFLYIAGVGITTILAGLATMPYTIFTFNQLTLQSILSNLAAIPLTGFVIMPAVLLSMISLIWGGFQPAFSLLEKALFNLIQIAEKASQLPGSEILVSQPPLAFLLLFTFGGLWLCFWQKLWRWWGGVPMIIAGTLFFIQTSPTIFVAENGSVIAVRQKDTLLLSTDRYGGFYVQQWLRALGLSKTEVWPTPVYRVSFKDKNLALIDGRHPQIAKHLPLSFVPDMVVINRSKWAFRKQIKRLSHMSVIDHRNLKKEGSHSLRIPPWPPHVKTVLAHEGQRPWVRHLALRKIDFDIPIGDRYSTILGSVTVKAG